MSAPLESLSSAERTTLRNGLQTRLAELDKRNLALDMTRGKPSSEQLDLANSLLSLPGVDDYTDQSGVDVRNYGGLRGLAEIRSLFGDILGVSRDNIMVGGNASLSLMHDALVRALLFGVPGGDGPWRKQGQLKWLCPTPGYDRHFALTEHLGFELISVPMTGHGPDINIIREKVANDAAIKGVWCVPRYSNPTGETYSTEVVHALASMPTAAPDFRIMWDNAYAEHHLSDAIEPLENMLSACEASGHPDRVLMFASTSKMSLAGAGLAAMASSVANLADAESHLFFQTIGPDKVNQLRHARFFPDIQALRAHMRQHARLIKPKFDMVNSVLTRELSGFAVASWTVPKGGYFVTLQGPNHTAAATVKRAAEIGVKLTPAGATSPYGHDAADNVIRIAPTFPPVEEVSLATEALALCLLLSALEQLEVAGT